MNEIKERKTEAFQEGKSEDEMMFRPSQKLSPFSFDFWSRSSVFRFPFSVFCFRFSGYFLASVSGGFTFSSPSSLFEPSDTFTS